MGRTTTGALMFWMLFLPVQGVDASDNNATEPPVPTSPPTTSPTFLQPECYNNLTVLVTHIVQKDPFQPRTFNLCPNTVFEIGFESEDGDLLCCIDGQSPILPRSNTRIYCGNDGDPANNCTLFGGALQLQSSYATFFAETENFEMRGVTFANADFAALSLGNGGDYVFKDCIFRDHTGVSAIISFHSPTGGLTDENGRTRQALLFDGCEFFGNKQGKRGGDEKYGIVTIEGPFDDVTFKDCYFHENDYGDPLDARGYAVYVPDGSTLRLSGNCFVNNNFVGEGVIIMESPEGLLQDENNFVTREDGLQCDFVAEHQPQEGEEELRCFGNPVDQCSIEGVVLDVSTTESNDDQKGSSNSMDEEQGIVGVVVSAVVSFLLL